jgi:hypothetical protein
MKLECKGFPLYTYYNYYKLSVQLTGSHAYSPKGMWKLAKSRAKGQKYNIIRYFVIFLPCIMILSILYLLTENKKRNAVALSSSSLSWPIGLH